MRRRNTVVPMRRIWGAIIGMAALLCAGCDSGSATLPLAGTPGGSPTPGSTQFPLPCGTSCRGGTGVGPVPFASVGDLRFPASDNPLVDRSPVAQEIFGAIWSGCLAQLPDLSLGAAGYVADQCTTVPTVANGGESADGLTTTIHLRSGLQWSDGSAISATDYALFLGLATDPQFGVQPDFSAVAQVQIPDAATVQIRWQQPNAAFLDALTQLIPMPHAVFPGIVSATGTYTASAATPLLHNPNFMVQLPVTNGPYVVQGGHAGSEVNLVKSADYQSGYFLQKGSPGIDLMRFHSLADALANFNQPTENQIELLQGLDETNLGSLGTIPASQVQVTPENAFTYLAFNQRAQATNAAHHQGSSIFAGTSGQLVRQALVEAFDRCAALQNLASALGTTCAHLALNENTTPIAADYVPSVALPGLNVSNAQHLLDQAGFPVAQSGANAGKRLFPDGVPLTLAFAVPNNPVLLGIANAAAHDWTINLNITVQVTPLDSLDGPNGVLASGAYDVALTTQTNGGDPADDFDFVQSSNIPGAAHSDGANSMGVNDSQLDAQIAAAAANLVPAQRQSAYRALQAYLTAHILDEPLYARNRVALVAPKFTGYQPSPVAPGDEWYDAGWKVRLI